MALGALLALTSSTLALGQSSGIGDDHLLLGAQHFREERFREALVEFRVAERTGADGGASWYVASTLVKLRRAEEAITAFARAEVAAPGERDALLDYYHALACYDAKLFGCADRLLAGIGEQGGPRIDAQARKIRSDLAPVLSGAPSTETIDWYHLRGSEAERSSREALALAYFEEALRLSTVRPDGYRRQEASRALRRLAPSRRAATSRPENTP